MPNWLAAVVVILTILGCYSAIGILHALFLPDKFLHFIGFKDTHQKDATDARFLLSLWPFFWLLLLAALIDWCITRLIRAVRDAPATIVASRNRRASKAK